MALFLLLVQGCAKPSPPQATVPDHPQEATYTAELAQVDQAWKVTYRFSQPRAALLFDTAHGDYRTTAWTPPEGAVIESLGGLDALFFDPPAREATFVIEPPEQLTDGTPAFMPFSDGSTAFYTGQLALLTVESREAAIALDGNLRAWTGEQPEVTVTLTDPLRAPDGTTTAVARFGRGPFIYSGDIERVAGRHLIDPGLPTWLAESFPERLDTVESAIVDAWGQEVPPPTTMLAWAGGGELRNRGRAEGRQITMVVRGDAYAEENPDAVGALTWFFAHEITHHHQFHDGGSAPAWMAEGFADTLATAICADASMYDIPALERRYWGVSRECARELHGRTLETARGRAAYVCGDLAGLAVMQLAPDHDLPAVWKAARSRAGGQFETTDLLAVLREAGAEEAKLQALESFVTTPHDDTDAAIRALLEASGLQPVYTDGSLSSMAFPFG